MHRVTVVGCWAGIVALAWLLLVRTIVSSGTGSEASGWSVMWASLLLLLTPLVTFVPIARWSRISLFDIEAVAGWATFGFTITFLRPSDPPTLAQFLVFLLPLTVSLATLGTLVSYAAGFRIYRDDPRRFDVVRARRQGYLGAFFVVALLLMHGIGTLTPTSGMFLLVIVSLAEMFWLARGTARVSTTRAVSRSR